MSTASVKFLGLLQIQTNGKKCKNAKKENNKRENANVSLLHKLYQQMGLCMPPRRYLRWLRFGAYASGQLKTFCLYYVLPQFTSKTEKRKRHLLRNLKALFAVHANVLFTRSLFASSSQNIKYLTPYLKVYTF